MLPSTPGATRAALKSTWQCSQMRDEMPALESEQAESSWLWVIKAALTPSILVLWGPFPFLLSDWGVPLAGMGGATNIAGWWGRSCSWLPRYLWAGDQRPEVTIISNQLGEEGGENYNNVSQVATSTLSAPADANTRRQILYQRVGEKWN